MQIQTTSKVRAARILTARNKDEGISEAIQWVSERCVRQIPVKLIGKPDKSCAPAQPSALEATLEDSRSMLELPEDWDDDGAKQIQESTWDRAAVFLRATSRRVSEAGRQIFPIPALKPCPDGSIDLHWKNELFEMLLNIPPVSCEAGDFYGESRDGLTIKGVFKPEIHHQGIVCWLLSNG